MATRATTAGTAMQNTRLLGTGAHCIRFGESSFRIRLSSGSSKVLKIAKKRPRNKHLTATLLVHLRIFIYFIYFVYRVSFVVSCGVVRYVRYKMISSVIITITGY